MKPREIQSLVGALLVAGAAGWLWGWPWAVLVFGGFLFLTAWTGRP